MKVREMDIYYIIIHRSNVKKEMSLSTFEIDSPERRSKS